MARGMGKGTGTEAGSSGRQGRPKEAGATIRRVWSYLGRQRMGLLIVCVTTILGAGFQLLSPYLIGKAIDDYILPKDGEGLLRIGLVLLGVYVLGSLTSWIQGYMMADVSQRTVSEMREDLFARFQRLPVRYFDKTPNGELMSRTTNDMENVSNTLGSSVTQILNSVITIVGAFVLMLTLNVSLTGVALLTIPLVLWTTRQLANRSKLLFREQQESLGRLNGYVEETVTGQKVMKLYRREGDSSRRFVEMNERYKNAGIKAQNLAGLMGPFSNVFNHLNFILLAAVGGWMALNQWTSIGIIVSFLNYSRQFSMPLNQLANQYNMIQSGIAGAERVFEIIDMPSEYDGDAGGARLVGGEVKGHVEFKGVTFGYTSERPTIRNLTFTARPGETIALVGPTGAGKTTIVNLLTRFYETDSGEILVDGVQIRHIPKDDLRSQLGIVLQDAYVFSDTIRENIRYGRLDATDAEVEAAARIANADSFIRSMPRGYETMLTSEGGNLSHGQRQLITIARAVLADPAVLVLDEATSSVDTRTEMFIQEGMNKLMKGRTCFVIAHRLMTIRGADLILVIRDGEIAERGNHEELLERKGIYYELYTKQFQQDGLTQAI